MKCCRSNIKVSIPNVGIAVTIPDVALSGDGAAFPVFLVLEWRVMV
jgi:hypothetical protein